jgi:hypothetical protein
MEIIARKIGRCAYPPIGQYIGTPPAAQSFERHEIKDHNFVPGMRLRPEGVRQPTAEANILANIRAIDQGRGSLNGDIMTSAWR